MDVNVRNVSLDQEGMNELYEKLNVPESVQGQMIVNINERFLFINYVPIEIIADFLANHMQDYERLIVSRDTLRGIYKIVDEKGYIRECYLVASIAECSEESKDMFSSSPWSILAIVMVSGLFDGINPCAFSILLFFVTFLVTVGITRFPGEIDKKIRVFGLTYILAIYLTYLAIGLSLRQAMSTIPFPYAMSKLFALVVLGAGMLHLMKYLRPESRLSLKIPLSQWKTIRRWMRKTTVPAVFVAGVLVGLFEFPCTGGIYVGILGMLTLRTTFVQGLLYLLIYNLMFVFPLMILLCIALNKKVTKFVLTTWQKQSEKRMRLLSSLFYIGLGVLLFFSGII